MAIGDLMHRRFGCGFRPLLAVVLVCLVAPAWADDGPLERGDFEAEEPGSTPQGWRFPSPRSKTAASVVEPGARGSKRSLRLVATPGGRPTVLERRFAAPADRLLLDLCFAFTEGKGETLVIQTEGRGSSRASQIRAAIRDGKLFHHDGKARAWTLITNRIEPTVDPAKPRWHRLEIRADREKPHVTFWVSPPGSDRLPERPTATHVAHRTGPAFHSLKLTYGLRSPKAFVLVDQILAKDASDVPPAWIRRLLERGRVTVEYYDRSKGKRGLGGLTKFWFKAWYRFNYWHRWSEAEGQRILSLKATLRYARVTTTHRIYVPDSYDKPGRWRRGLMRHEFEHVAISTDPRLHLLLEHICRKIGWVQRKYDADVKGSAALYKKVSIAEMGKRRSAINELIQKNYRYFDQVCKHGRKAIKDRRAFFEGLYTLENLEAMGFKYLEEARDLLDTEAYQAAQPCCGD